MGTKIPSKILRKGDIMWKDEIRKQRSDEQQLRMDILDFADDTMSRILVDFRKMFKDDTIRGDDSYFLDFRQKLREFALDYAGLE